LLLLLLPPMTGTSTAVFRLAASRCMLGTMATAASTAAATAPLSSASAMPARATSVLLVNPTLNELLLNPLAQQLLGLAPSILVTEYQQWLRISVRVVTAALYEAEGACSVLHRTQRCAFEACDEANAILWYLEYGDVLAARIVHFDRPDSLAKQPTKVLSRSHPLLLEARQVSQLANVFDDTA